MAATTPKQLPAKENSLFRSVVKCYEMKQYKKGLKAADAILRKFPEHGETLAMKGLTLNCMGKKEEAYDYVRNGLKHDLKSHVCWHVFGLLYRFDRNYTEAIKCYRNAIRLDPENLQILRDLYLLQVQMRDLKGFAETRRTLLTLKPNNRNNWIGFAIAHHLVGNYQMAIDILEKYFSTLETTRAQDYEDSEMYLYLNLLLEESGDLNKALAHLESSKNRIMDTLIWRQKKAEFLLQLERYEEAREVYEELLEINFDNSVYHRGMQCALLERKDWFKPRESVLPSAAIDFSKEPKGDEYVETLLKYYADKQPKVDAKSTMCYRISMDVATGEAFTKVADALMRMQLSRGVPSLGSEIKAVYADKEKAALIDKLLQSYLELLADGKTLQNDARATVEETQLWTWYFASQHFDRLGQRERAIEFADKCINQSPKVLDFYQRKARVLKHMGDLDQAADVMVQGRKLDLADRYINNKATEYLLHADRVADADATIALFTRHEGDPQQNLLEMQCMWYEIENGQSQLRQKKYGLALKRFFAVEKHFDDFIEDQFDFHTYCVRKMTLRAYLSMLRVCDEMYGHKFFVEAAHGAIKTYLELAENADREAENGASGDLSGLSAAEKKKAKRAQAKARKAEFRKKEEEELRAKIAREAEEKEAKKKGASGSRRDTPKDTDPQGDELVKKPALEEAWRFVAKLQQYAGANIRTHLAAFDVAVRKKKPLLCLQALLRAQHCSNLSDAQRSEIASRRAQFANELEHVSDPIVLQVINEMKAQLEQ